MLNMPELNNKDVVKGVSDIFGPVIEKLEERVTQ
jgi:hypothetical protein